MQNRLAIGRGVKILDKKKPRGGLNEPPPPCQFKGYISKQQHVVFLTVRFFQFHFLGMCRESLSPDK